jgi:HK97 family phage major capsid protein
MSTNSETDLRKLLFCKMASGGVDDTAIKIAENMRAHNVVELLKTASPAAGVGTLTGPFSVAMTRMIAALQPRGAFNTMQTAMTQVPLRTRVIVSTANLVASEVAEGEAKQIRRLNIAELDTEVSKFASAITMSQEFIDQAPDLATRVISEALAEAVSKSVDTYFLSKLQAAGDVYEGETNVNPTWNEVLDELGEMLRLVRTGESSRLYFIMPAPFVKYLSTLAYQNSVTTVKYAGGEILGVPVVASDALSSSIVLADASAIVYGDGGIDVRSSDVAFIQAQDDSTQSSDTPTATTGVSCFQTNTRCCIAERRVAVRVVDVAGLATVTGLAWAAGEGSPF